MIVQPFDVSVVIPARNRAQTLPYCLDSVLAQTQVAREVIVVDDGSTDGTAELVQSYAPRGVVYRRLSRGRGAQAARNEGVRTARFPWIAFQDSDDLWLPDKLAWQFEALGRAGGGADVVVHGNALQRQEGSTASTPLPMPETAGHCHADLLRRPGPMFQALLVSRQAIEQAGYLDEGCPAYQEWDAALRLSRHCRFIHLPQPLFIWVWHASETISKDVGRDVTGYNYILDHYRDEVTRVHGARFWRAQKLNQAVKAMRAGLWDLARAQLENAGRHPSLALAKTLARVRLAPPGIGRLLRLAA